MKSETFKNLTFNDLVFVFRSNLILQTKNLETFGCFYSLANVLLCCLFVVTGTLYTDNKSTPAATSSFCFKVDKSKFHFFLGISTAAVFVV